MKKTLILAIGLAVVAAGFAQTAPDTVYRATAEKINDLVHTKLDARFDYPNAQLIGKAWLTLKPHFYPTDSLSLDAKGMEIKTVAVVKNGKNTPLKFGYDGQMLDIVLDKTYKNNESYTVYIDYIAKPNEYKAKGSAAITDAKGLYFIDPTDTDPEKPTQIWTQGETEATSVWIPIIDKPNQKTTQEISMTVPAKYVTLSNGRLASQRKNTDGTRTDVWKMDLPHAPYLFFMGVGEYAVVKDQYKGKEVSYYVEKEYAPVARKIFGGTPEMIALFSRLTGVDYPWAKYSQIVGRDYVSGAMENTTATLHQESAQQDARELTDGNRWEEVIAHELFHQWFGDYVTSESWSNLTLNESFATLGSQLWNEYKYGKEAGDEERYNSAKGYLGSKSESKDLVRFRYNDKEDMFDAVSYNKGGAILQMLRAYTGDSAFFKALNLYLTSNKFKSAEAQQLRLAFEEVTGKDMNWFWNQWYYGSGHPVLDVSYSYDANAKQVVLITRQTGKTFRLPVKVDVYNSDMPTRYTIWVEHAADTFRFPAPSKPALVNFDAEKKLLAAKTEHKSLEEYLYQYRHAGNYVDRREAIDAALASSEQVTAITLLTEAAKDHYAPLRQYVFKNLNLSVGQVKNGMQSLLLEAAKSDNYRPARAEAIAKLGNYRNASYAPVFRAALNDSSYTVAGNALEALNKVDTTAALSEAKRLSTQTAKGKLEAAIQAVVGASGGEQLLKDFEAMPMGQAKFGALEGVFNLIAGTDNFELFKRGVDDILALESQIPESFRAQVVTALNTAFREVQKDKAANGLKQHADYLESKLPKEEKKDF